MGEIVGCFAAFTVEKNYLRKRNHFFLYREALAICKERLFVVSDDGLLL